MILPIITANINQKLPIIESEIALNGKVIQVMESSGTTQLRIAVNDDYEYHPETKIARNKTMFVFNAEIMQKLDDLEDFILKGVS